MQSIIGRMASSSSSCWLALLCACAVRDQATIGDASSTSDTDAEVTSTTATPGDESMSTTTPTDESTTGGDVPTCEAIELALTSACVVGYDITSEDVAHAICQDEFGPEWSWLEFHAHGAWTVFAQAELAAWHTDTRAWAWIDDQDAECFSSPIREIIPGQPEAFGMTWQPFPPDDNNCIAATCNDATGLDGPGFDPHLFTYQDDQFNEVMGSKCNPYEGDTPCSLCRPLLCVRDI